MQGLENLGATCSINSLVQIICRNDHLRNIIMKYEMPEDTLVYHLKELLVLMHDEGKSLVPKKFIKKIFNTFKNIFNYGEQLDIHELWIYISDYIVNEINTKSNYNKQISTHQFKDKIENGVIIKDDIEFNKMLLSSNNLKDKFAYYNIKLNGNKTSEWQDSIQGFYLNIISCLECNNRLYNFEPFTTLNLNIMEKNLSIADMIKQIYNIENDCDWECEHCKRKTKNQKQTKLWKLPDVLFITINRFTDLMRKNNNPININDFLNFNKGSILSNTDIDKRYKLSSLGLHVGSLNSGHYMAICNVDDNYYLYNDLSVKNIDNFTNNNSAAYMIVYSKL